MLSKKEVQQIAHLARLKLSDKETSRYQQELTEIINYINKLKNIKIPADNLKKTCRNNFRKDKAQENSKQNIRELFSSTELHKKYVKIPSIFK